MRAPPRVADEAGAYLLFERLRWAGTPTTCPHCGASGRCQFLRPANGSSRRTRTGAASARRVWKCGTCRRQFSVLTGTVFEGTKIGLCTWIGVVFDVITGAGVLAAQVSGRHGVSPETARHMLARLDAAGLGPGRADRPGQLSPGQGAARLRAAPAPRPAAISQSGAKR